MGQDQVDVDSRKAEKRLALDDPWRGEESKQQRIGDSPMDAVAFEHVMASLERAERALSTYRRTSGPCQ